MLPFDPSELVRYGGLTLVARQVVEGFLSGVHHNPFRRLRADFTEHRPYYPGDELRRIDWRASGKTDQFLVKQYEEETNLHAFLVVDASGSMRYKGKAGASKFGFAQQVAASLAYLMLAQHDAVGLAIHDTKVRQIVAPKASAKHLLGLLRGLEAAIPGGETALAPIWHDLAVKHLPRRGQVVLLSDCFDQPHHLIRALQHFRYRKHEVLLFHILAAEEIEFPFDRYTRFRDLEKLGQTVRVDARRLREEYRANFEAHRTELRRAAHELGIDYHLLRTDQSVDQALGVYLAKRRSRDPRSR